MTKVVDNSMSIGEFIDYKNAKNTVYALIAKSMDVYTLDENNICRYKDDTNTSTLKEKIEEVGEQFEGKYFATQIGVLFTNENDMKYFVMKNAEMF